MDAYSEHLRRKIVEAVQQRRMNKSEAARAFGVSLSSVKRYTKAVREGRSLSPGKAKGKRPTLDEKARRLLEAHLEERPFAKLSERRYYLQKVADRPPFSVPVTMRVWVRILASLSPLWGQSSVPTELRWPQTPPGSDTPKAPCGLWWL